MGLVSVCVDLKVNRIQQPRWPGGNSMSPKSKQCRTSRIHDKSKAKKRQPRNRPAGPLREGSISQSKLLATIDCSNLLSTFWAVAESIRKRCFSSLCHHILSSSSSSPFHLPDCFFLLLCQTAALPVITTSDTN